MSLKDMWAEAKRQVEASEAAKRGEPVAQHPAPVPTRKFDGKLSPWKISGGKLSYRHRTVDAAGIEWEVQSGQELKRVTASRVALVGPFALLVKKKTTSVYLAATLATGEQFVDEYPLKEEPEVRKFVAKARGLTARANAA